MPGRQVPAGDPVTVVLVDQAALATAQVLPDVVQVDVDGRHVAPAGPVLGRRVEDHLDLGAVGRLPLDERAQRDVDLVDHPVTVPFERLARHRVRDRLQGRASCPIGHPAVGFRLDGKVRRCSIER